MEECSYAVERRRSVARCEREEAAKKLKEAEQKVNDVESKLTRLGLVMDAQLVEQIDWIISRLSNTSSIVYVKINMMYFAPIIFGLTGAAMVYTYVVAGKHCQ